MKYIAFLFSIFCLSIFGGYIIISLIYPEIPTTIDYITPKGDHASFNVFLYSLFGLAISVIAFFYTSKKESVYVPIDQLTHNRALSYIDQTLDGLQIEHDSDTAELLLSSLCRDDFEICRLK